MKKWNRSYLRTISPLCIPTIKLYARHRVPYTIQLSIMATVTLFPDKPQEPQTVTYEYSFNSRYDYHRARLALDPQGNYEVTVDGVANSTYEASAKRNPNYKTGMSYLANQMLTAISTNEAAYRDIYKNTAHLAVGRYKEREMADTAKKTDADIEAEADKKVKKADLASIVPKKFNKATFSGKAPSKGDVEAKLRDEADHKFFSIWKNRSAEKNQFIDKNEEAVLKDRQEKYDELKSYFDKIQDTLGATTNASYLKEYHEKRKKAVEEYNNRRKAFIDNLKNRRDVAVGYLTGPKDYVDDGIKDLKNRSHLPFKVKLTTKYVQKESLLNVEVSVPVIIHIPMTKGTLLSSGRVSIKSKLQREMYQDMVLCQLGIAYYLCGFLFNISANIKTIRFSLLASDNGDGYYWVQFPRDQFFTLDFSNIDPLLTLERYPHVIKYGKISLEPINASTFKAKINDALLIAGQASSSNQTVLSLTDAEHILDAMPNSVDLKKAVEESKTKGQSVVVADKKYENILKEL